MQTFVLAPQSAKKFYVHNDIFRYQDEVYQDNSDSESEDHQQETTNNIKSAHNNYYQQANDQAIDGDVDAHLNNNHNHHHEHQLVEQPVKVQEEVKSETNLLNGHVSSAPVVAETTSAPSQQPPQPQRVLPNKEENKENKTNNVDLYTIENHDQVTKTNNATSTGAVKEESVKQDSQNKGMFLFLSVLS